MQNRHWLLLISLLALALRIPGAFWGHIDRAANIWEPDEFQHEQIATEQMNFLDSTLYSGRDFSTIWNVRSYGIQLGTMAYLGYRAGLLELKPHKIVFAGRFLSIIYSLLLVLLVYLLANFLFDSSRIALLAALLMSGFDLNITYSHYALPESSYVFWMYAAVFTLIFLYKKVVETPPSFPAQWSNNFILLLFTPFPLAMSFATKFDFLPLALCGLLLFFLVFRKELQFAAFFTIGIWILLVFVGYYWLAHAFNITFDDIERSYKVIRALNEDVVPEDKHWLHNPILYLSAVIGGSSLPIVILTGITLWLFAKNGNNPLPFLRKHTVAGIVLLCLFIGLEFLVRWRIDTPFVRRANEFLPFCALLAAYGLHYFSYQKQGFWRRALPATVVVYTLCIAIVAQYNFWNDNRFLVQDYLQEHYPNQPAEYSVYASTVKSNVAQDSDILVIHEAYYGRFWKSFTTPFKVPQCCKEVYHCSDQCDFYQQLLRGETEYKLVKTFPTLEIFPERLLYKHLYGTYETFLGDMRIYEKR